ncbi:hypothetical protein ALC56_02891 [Trachymyrmex septentrionalis]|uniref:Nuclease HARBI1 n=1 Tax=Trachymyrmex septentrionalis TaxID=34720 RepID=A0A151K051_9HYME|nr:hypothetical protein ALC56_02891 [Trachymyrmex septentrionalis]
MTTIDSYRSICNRFNIDKATALRAVRRVTRILIIEAPQFISWLSYKEAQIIMRKFEEARGFLNTIGAINGTHIRIEASKENPVTVYDHRALITHYYVGHPGSVHDSEVTAFLNNKEKFPYSSHLIGDAAYESHEHLLVLFKNYGHLIDTQKHYNFLLKGPMRSWMHCLPIVRMDLILEYIVACCITHNICILRQDELTIILLTPEEITTQDKSKIRCNWYL